ncbi:hypothetical protein [Streptacidiphilus carbonis]|uniref:hypothetical protein n=1 Tax=Streptacidiphilus carbonis TaxID=105422 RepID=UPI0005AABCFF|nr:hypothetical protein [Streptacidiphilus carbonis]
MANISFGIFMLVFVTCMSVFMVRAAWLHWIDSDRAPEMPGVRTTNPSVIRGHERGIVPLAGWLALTNASILIGLINSQATTGVALVLLFSSFVMLLLHASVAWFNWPKFLVPPHLRHDTGSIVEWYEHRRDLRAALAEAAERDALGHRSDPR